MMRWTLSATLSLCCLTAPTLFGADAANGAKLFGTKCKSCHGAEGQGNPAIAKALKVTFKDLRSPEVQKKSDEQLKKEMAGGWGSKKPVKLTPAEADDILAHMRSMKK